MISRLKKLFGSKQVNYDYKSVLSNYFSIMGISYDEVERHLKDSVSEKILYFTSTEGQQLEALIFSAISRARLVGKISTSTLRIRFSCSSMICR